MSNKEEISATTALFLEKNQAIGDKIFHVPENYFRQFPEQVLTAIRASETEPEAQLPGVPELPYTVPEHYFELLEGRIADSIADANAVILDGRHPWEDRGKTPYFLPSGYFTHFEQKLTHELFQSDDDLDIADTWLAGLPKEAPFTVPGGYFEKNISVAGKKGAPASRVLEHPAVRSIKWARWAAAAAVTLIFSIGGLQFLSPRQQTVNKGFQQALAAIPEANLKEWLSANMDESDINNMNISIAHARSSLMSYSLRDFSDKELEDYIEAEVW